MPPVTGPLMQSNNLSDVLNASAALTSLGAPQLGNSNTWTNSQVFSGAATFSSTLQATNSLVVPEGSNAYMGLGTANGTTAVTIATTAFGTASRVFLTIQTPTGTPGAVYVSAGSAGTSFSTKSTSATDTSTFAWLIVNHT